MPDATRPTNPEQLRAQALDLRQAAHLRAVLDQIAPQLALAATTYTRLNEHTADVTGLDHLGWLDTIAVLGLHDLNAAHATLTEIHDHTGAVLGL